MTDSKEENDGDGMDTYQVKVDSFEGPLDLLLHLISQAEVDIYDIPVARITDQYLQYVHAMQRLELDVVSEYLVMAATLIHMKSQLLLPKREEVLFDGEDWVEEDPRDALVEQLLEYRTLKEAAKSLQQTAQERDIVYTRPPESLDEFLNEEEKCALQIGDVGVADMVRAFQQMLARQRVRAPKLKVIQREVVSVEARMEEIATQLKACSGRTAFETLLASGDRADIVVTFLALLELMKTRVVRCVQERNFTDMVIYIRDEAAYAD